MSPPTLLPKTSPITPTRIASNPISKLAHLLLIIIRRQRARCTQRNRHGRSASRLQNPRHRRTQQQHAISQRELSAVLAVLLDEVACAV